MNRSAPMLPLAENLWLLPFPLKLFGADLRRNVTLIRLRSGKFVIHSTAPFSAEDVADICSHGTPGWILDGILRHDTFAADGRRSFPDIPYLAPEGFARLTGIPTQLIIPPPPEWDGELLALEIQGAPQARDTALLHVPSRTLILTELLFNFSLREPLWTRLLLNLGVGRHFSPGVSRPVRAGVEDKAAFEQSLEEILAWDFDRIVVGHGDPIPTGGKGALRKALSQAGFLAG